MKVRDVIRAIDGKTNVAVYMDNTRHTDILVVKDTAENLGRRVRNLVVRFSYENNDPFTGKSLLVFCEKGVV